MSRQLFLSMVFLGFIAASGWGSSRDTSLSDNESNYCKKKQHINNGADSETILQLQNKVTNQVKHLIESENAGDIFVHSLGIAKSGEFTEKQKILFARFLIQNYSHILFRSLDLSEHAYTKRKLRLEFEKEQFLLEKVFPNLGRFKIEADLPHFDRTIYYIYKLTEASQKYNKSVSIF